MAADVGDAPAASYEYFDRLEYDSGRFFIRHLLLKFAAFTSLSIQKFSAFRIWLSPFRAQDGGLCYNQNTVSLKGTDMAQQGTLYIISSPSGAGKSSLLNALLTQHNSAGRMQLSVSHTTRATRPGEEHGVHYHFVKVEEFKALIERGDFLEWAEVFGNYYGTSRAAIEACLAQGIDVFLDIDWQGARQIREQMPTKSIFILPPSREELERRLIGRGQDSAEVIKGRMEKAIAEMVHYDEYDYVIINEDFEQALFQLRAVIECQRLELRQQQQAQQNLLQQLLAE